MTVETLAFTHSVASADELWNGLLGGTVRISALILRQPQPVQERIHAEFDRLAKEYRSGDHLEIPVSVKLAAGRKPAHKRQPPTAKRPGSEI